MNYWVYFNQRLVIDPSDLLIMDDAHLAGHCLNSLFSVEIDRYAHEPLFRSVITELNERFPEYSVLADALVPHPPTDTPPELLSFIDQDSVVDRLREVIDVSGALKTDSDLSFRWKRLRNLLIGRGTKPIPENFRNGDEVEIVVVVYDQNGKKHRGKFKARASKWYQHRQILPTGDELLR